MYKMIRMSVLLAFASCLFKMSRNHYMIQQIWFRSLEWWCLVSPWLITVVISFGSIQSILNSLIVLWIGMHWFWFGIWVSMDLVVMDPIVFATAISALCSSAKVHAFCFADFIGLRYSLVCVFSFLRL